MDFCDVSTLHRFLESFPSTGIVPFLYPDFQVHVVLRRGTRFAIVIKQIKYTSNQVLKVNDKFIHMLYIDHLEKMHFLAGSVLALPRDLGTKNLTVEVALTDFELGIPQPCRANVTSKILGSNHESSSSWVTRVHGTGW